ncbi:2'-5' RNA ligase family protein [Burkholderia cenocepacia]|uniref:2'-5' RNA ligase family protein n=1 Tax=Burkholderia cepacia complex TaxID=87882 RepID=UPI00054FD8BB|nr:2'-5' RNA ligase family protein [Burkholderia cenocepacia]RQV55448.1 ligase [Burkholderia cenocepacia]SDR12967.1 2'-5' RNA ligase [Burkholderia orbicola]
MQTDNTAVPQLTLPGFEATRLMPEHRLFFAVMPDPGTATRMTEQRARLGSDVRISGRPLHAERLHVTLYSLGDFVHVPEVVVERACFAATTIDVPPFGVTFDQMLRFNGRPGHRPFVLTGSDGLDALVMFQRSLVEALRGTRLRISGTSFTPHVTLLYGDGKFSRCDLEPVTWTVNEFVLIHSWLGKTHYDVIGRWPLTGRVAKD